MDVLATRALSFTDDNGDSMEVTLTVFQPFEAERQVWKCKFQFGPPIHREAIAVAGVDYIQAVVGCLEVARGYLNGTKLWGRVQWQDMADCGLPWYTNTPPPLRSTDIPPAEANPGNLRVLTNRTLGLPDDSGTEREIVLTVFAPFQAQDGAWRCGFAFGALESAPIRYGDGADFIEALLDALAGARATFDAMLPHDWHPPDTSTVLDCTGLPRKVGRSFWIDTSESDPSTPE